MNKQEQELTRQRLDAIQKEVILDALWQASRRGSYGERQRFLKVYESLKKETK